MIDHHRRAATYIENATLNFHEPYASSAAELVAEMLQYLVDQTDILRLEAEALLSGIVLDTKSFSIRTGSRTFDAAGYLRRCGADTVEVKRLLQSDFDETIEKYSIIRGARIYRPGVAIASSEESESRVLIAQAADELLNIAGIQASFVFRKRRRPVHIGQSIGNINSVIMENSAARQPVHRGRAATARASRRSRKTCRRPRQLSGQLHGQRIAAPGVTHSLQYRRDYK